MTRNAKRFRVWIVYLAIMALALLPAFLAPTVRGQETSAPAAPGGAPAAAPADTAAPAETAAPAAAPAVKLSPESQACMDCHSEAQEGKAAVHLGLLQKSPHADLDCQSCHSDFTPEYPHTPAMLKSRPDCGSCHTDEADAYAKSVHAHKDKVPGDHPKCVTCHTATSGGDPHGILVIKNWTRADKTKTCIGCHGQKDRMDRYGVDPDAVPSYLESFHGKALLHFGKTNTAGCVDCHRAHDVRSPYDQTAPTFQDNAAKTCGQSGCHPGAKMNFAMSGANHLRLMVKVSPVLTSVLWFFRTLVFGMVIVLMLGVALDLRTKVFGRGHRPHAGRLVAALISASFLFMSLALALATLNLKGALPSWIAALVFMAVAFLVYSFRKRNGTEHRQEKQYPRLSLTLRIQHVLLALSFTTLALTGLPMRFSQSSALAKVYILFGGLDNARIVHRVAAVIMITTWLWHLGWLFVRWAKTGFSLKAWTMVPTISDLKDMLRLVWHYVGLRHDAPKYGRLPVREKMDYFAEYWGIPVMLVSGLILWFPIYWGNTLPETAVSIAYIAHSYEATLAFLAVVTWHMYNSHLNPDRFPMSPSWLTGTLPESEMAVDHPLELERIESGEITPQQAQLGGPIERTSDDTNSELEKNRDSSNEP